MKITLPLLHEVQQEIAASTARFNWINCGRGLGKTRYGARKSVHHAGAKGETILWGAPIYKQAKVGWKLMRSMAAQIKKHVKAVDISESELRIGFPSGGEVFVRSLDDPDSARGIHPNGMGLDEAAYIKERAWSEVLQPATLNQQAWVDLISTPNGRNWFYRGCMAAKEGLVPDSAYFHFSTFDSPVINAAEKQKIREAYEQGRIPDRTYRQEYLAEFIDDAGCVFRGVRAAATADPLTHGEEGKRYVIGADWGKHNDFTVLWVIDPETCKTVALDRFNQIDYTFQVRRLQELCSRFPPLEIVAESNSMGEPIIEQIRQLDLPVRAFNTTNATKKVAIESLALAIENGRLELLGDEVALMEFEAYEMQRSPTGAVRYNAPEGMHDDCVMGAALAWDGVEGGNMGVVAL